jgi:hypothetical protein
MCCVVLCCAVLCCVVQRCAHLILASMTPAAPACCCCMASRCVIRLSLAARAGPTAAPAAAIAVCSALICSSRSLICAGSTHQVVGSVCVTHLKVQQQQVGCSSSRLAAAAAGWLQQQQVGCSSSRLAAAAAGPWWWWMPSGLLVVPPHLALRLLPSAVGVACTLKICAQRSKLLRQPGAFILHAADRAQHSAVSIQSGLD